MAGGLQSHSQRREGLKFATGAEDQHHDAHG
jgi:hypothetical protein